MGIKRVVVLCAHRTTYSINMFLATKCNKKASKDSCKVKTYQALQFDSKSKYIKLAKIPLVTQLKDNDVWVEVAYAGICGTDLHVTEGKFPCKKTPVVLGHEICGIVKKVGVAVRHIKTGDKVAINPNNECQRCESCANGKPHFCENEGPGNCVGYYKDGGWAEYCRVPQNLVFKLPDSVNLEQAVLCEPLSCIVHAMNVIDPVPINTNILISGAGIAGTLMAMIFRYKGYQNVTISEVNERRLDQARMNFSPFGYDVVNPSTLRCEPGALGVELAIDCSGNLQAMEDAISWLCPGGVFLLYGVVPGNVKMKLSPYKILSKELKIFGSLVNPHTFPEAIKWADLLGSKYLNFGKLAIRTYELCHFSDALKDLRDGDILKAVFKFNIKETDKKAAYL